MLRTRMGRRPVGNWLVAGSLMLVGWTPGQGQPVDGKPASPLEGLSGMVGTLKAQGKDVARFESELEALRPEWEAIEVLQRQIHEKAESFRPKVEALARAIQEEAGGAGAPGESPIEALQRGLEALHGQGREVADLQAELDGLRPEFETIHGAHQELAKLAPDERETRARSLQPQAESLRAKVEALARKVHDRAAGQGAPPK